MPAKVDKLQKKAEENAQNLEKKRGRKNTSILTSGKSSKLKFKNQLYNMAESDIQWLNQVSEELSEIEGRKVSKSEIVRIAVRNLQNENMSNIGSIGK